MKAYVLNKTGGVENLVLSEIEPPDPKADEVLVEIKAISINPVDVKTRAAREVLDMIVGTEPPVILGWDIAGKVTAVGDKITQFVPGDSVFGMVNFPGEGRAYAEYVAAPGDQLAKIPADTSFEDAAATTLAAMIALQVLQSRVKQDDRVLIHAGSGGVGHFAIQIAKHLGAYVVSTSSAKNRDFVMALGADKHIDYQQHKFEEVVSGMDFVLDTMGADVLKNSLKVVKDGGKIVSLPSPEFPQEVKPYAQKRNIDVSFVLVESNGSDMNTLKDMLEAGVLKPHISKIFPFEELAEAHLQLETGRTVGKVIVKL
ncbi:NADP-dependent oxidoreductase [Syntrophotalea acetylenica]|uniref:NADP-dependent oxidoreductase n=1 Tax=Syntrophotalea acetylenica TaxID=29542 RepID=UPI002A3688DE|nr:NADP-dependent oxidoreductase [Syntrophotalea acetylenica]MDY0263458.1 NADP-dependent oxidoreductase [Syntrophotalea acetylenica]